MPYRPAWLPKAWPWLPPDYDEHVVYAVRSIVDGVANAEQQKLFWNYIMYVTKASQEFQDLSFRPGDRSATDFAEGSRFVGIELRKLLHPATTPKTDTQKKLSTLAKRRGKMKGKR